MKNIAFVSDLHCGSTTGLLPPGFKTSEGVVAPMTVGQKYLWKCWQRFRQQVNSFGRIDALIFDGDIVDGTQVKEGGGRLSLRSIVDQREAAVKVIEYLVHSLPTCPVYFVQGTRYHVGENAEAEEYVAARLGAERYHSIGAGRLVREVLWLDIDGVIIEVAHALGGATGFYRATALDRELQWSAISAKDKTKGVPKADLLVRAHLHFFNVVEHASKVGVILPCWQLQTAFARRSSVHRMHPDIGGVVISIDPPAKKDGRNPFQVHKFLYKLPPVPITSLENSHEKSYTAA